jgi:hypothetical protein
MRLLADENFPRAVIRALVAHGHDVAAIWDDARGSDDQAVLDRAQNEGRIRAMRRCCCGRLAAASQPEWCQTGCAGTPSRISTSRSSRQTVAIAASLARSTCSGIELTLSLWQASGVGTLTRVLPSFASTKAMSHSSSFLVQ